MTKLRKILERRQKTRFWGRDYFVTPRLVSQVFGDGLKLLGLWTINSRPSYYVIRIESSWNESNWSEGDKFIDHLEEIYQAIEADFGRAWYDDDPPQRKNGRPFPALHEEDGCGWFLIPWPKGVRKPRRKVERAEGGR